MFGINAALNQIGFNWIAFFRAIGDTKPIGACERRSGCVAVLAIAMPLLAIEGLTAFGVGMGIATLIGVAVRLWYLGACSRASRWWRTSCAGSGRRCPRSRRCCSLRAVETGAHRCRRVAIEVGAVRRVVVAGT